MGHETFTQDDLERVEEKASAIADNDARLNLLSSISELHSSLNEVHSFLGTIENTAADIPDDLGIDIEKDAVKAQKALDTTFATSLVKSSFFDTMDMIAKGRLSFDDARLDEWHGLLRVVQADTMILPQIINSLPEDRHRDAFKTFLSGTGWVMMREAENLVAKYPGLIRPFAEYLPMEFNHFCSWMLSKDLDKYKDWRNSLENFFKAVGKDQPEPVNLHTMLREGLLNDYFFNAALTKFLNSKSSGGMILASPGTPQSELGMVIRNLHKYGIDLMRQVPGEKKDAEALVAWLNSLGNDKFKALTKLVLENTLDNKLNNTTAHSTPLSI